MENEIKIPMMVESSEGSEHLEREVRKKLAQTCLKGKGKYKIRTASGCFNEWIIKK